VGSVRVRRTAGRVTAKTIDDLAAITVTSIGGAHVTDVRVRVADYRLPRGWVGSPDLHGLQSVEVRPRDRGVEVRITVEQPKDIAVLCAAAWRMLCPVRGPRATFTSSLPATATSLAPAVRDIYADDVHAHLRRADTIIGASIDPEQFDQHVVPEADGYWSIDGQRAAVFVDPAIHRPFGRVSDLGYVVADAPTQPWLASSDIAALQSVSVIRGNPNPVVTAQLHAAGLVLESEIDSREPFDIQVASVRARRTALRAFTWPAALHAWPSVSAVLLTNRVTHLERICTQLAALDYPHLQVVIGLHGLSRKVLPANIPNATIIEIDGAVPFGAAMQQASTAADGALITKIDDDDRYAPQHIWDLVLARLYSGATIVGKALDWIYLANEQATVFRPVYAAEKYGKFVAGGTMMISASDLAEVGGWRPVPRSIDRALLEDVRRSGGLVYRTHGLGYIYVRRTDGHTARVDNAHFRTKASRILDGLIDHPEFR